MLPGPTPAGVVAAGGEPTPDMLKQAYPQGIFPWPHDELPLLWFSPDPRFVLPPREAHLHRSLRKRMRKDPFVIKADTAFQEVMRGCQAAWRPGQSGTWITDAMVEGYGVLHDEGIAHSVEAWSEGGELVGGLYGVSFGRVFFGESMFATQPDASKVAFGTLIAQLVEWGFWLIDCQTYTDHLARFGAYEVSRHEFLELLADNRVNEDRLGPWEIELKPSDAVRVLDEFRDVS
jgi:leucyl/phenylalanyl-tRNA--protein transferase